MDHILSIRNGGIIMCQTTTKYHNNRRWWCCSPPPLLGANQRESAAINMFIVLRVKYWFHRSMIPLPFFHSFHRPPSTSEPANNHQSKTAGQEQWAITLTGLVWLSKERPGHLKRLPPSRPVHVRVIVIRVRRRAAPSGRRVLLCSESDDDWEPTKDYILW